ncbi:nonribosomal peptide synthase SidD, partial [Aureobasidium melanogenum]
MGYKHITESTSSSDEALNNTSRDCVSSYNMDKLAFQSSTAPSGMREDILLASWLIVLLKTREGERVTFGWSYQSSSDASEQPCRHISMENVMKGLQDSVDSVIRTIASQISAAKSCGKSTEPVLLLLSTGLLQQQQQPDEQPMGTLHLSVRFLDGNIKIQPAFRSKDILDNEVTRYINSLADTIQLCISKPEITIQDSLRPTPSDLDEIWRYNNQLPPTYDFCMHEMVSERAQQFPNKVAIDSWDGTLTFVQIDQYSTSMAQSLIAEGVRPHEIVPLCFEKSRWAIIAVLATMKAGATFAMMDPSLPLARLQNMAVQIGAK